MRGIIKHISVIFLLLCSAGLAHAQSSKALLENRVLSAVQKYDAGAVDDAIKMLLPVVEIDPTNDAAYYYLAQSYIRKKELDAAEVYLQKAVELDGKNFWYRQRLATLYAATSRGELAISIYEKLLEDFPKKSDLYLELVELYAAMGEIDKALETIEVVETVFGVTETLAVYRFNLLRTTDRQEEAFKSLEAYNEKYSSPYVLSTLADWHISQYNDSTALAYYNEALDLDSSYAPAQLGKAEVLRMRRNYGGFFSMLNKFVKNEETVVGAKTDYLMAVVQRTDPKFLRTFSSEMDTVMTSLLSKHAKDSAALASRKSEHMKTAYGNLREKNTAPLDIREEAFDHAVTETDQNEQVEKKIVIVAVNRISESGQYVQRQPLQIKVHSDCFVCQILCEGVLEADRKSEQFNRKRCEQIDRQKSVQKRQDLFFDIEASHRLVFNRRIKYGNDESGNEQSPSEQIEKV